MVALSFAVNFTPRYLSWTLPSLDLDKSIIDKRGTEVISQIQDNCSPSNIKIGPSISELGQIYL